MATRRRLLGLGGGTACAVLLGCAIPAGATSTAVDAPREAPRGSTEQVLSVVRPEGHLVMTDTSAPADGRLHLQVIDTRPDDPGWNVVVSVHDARQSLRWSSEVVSTPSYWVSDGRRYDQRATPGPGDPPGPGPVTIATAPAHHGLGIAEVDAGIAGPEGPSVPLGVVLTITVV
jgi:hypothetical protein